MSDQPTKMCPILSVAGLRRDGAKLVSLGGAPGASEGEAIACQGSACMLYCPIADETGKVVAANCALALIPLSMTQVAAAVQGLTTQSQKV